MPRGDAVTLVEHVTLLRDLGIGQSLVLAKPALDERKVRFALPETVDVGSRRLMVVPDVSERGPGIGQLR